MKVRNIFIKGSRIFPMLKTWKAEPMRDENLLSETAMDSEMLFRTARSSSNVAILL